MGASVSKGCAITLSLAAVVLLGCAGGGSKSGSRSVASVPRTRCAPATHSPRQSVADYNAYRAGRTGATRTAHGAGFAATGRTPVDLPTVMRLAAGQNLDVSLVRQELREAHAELRYSKNWWLPNLTPTLQYEQTTGTVQGTVGNFVDVNKRSSFAGAGLYGDWAVGESIYRNLAARRRTNASEEAVTAGINDATLGAALAYFDLLRGQMALGIADEILTLYEGLVKETQAQVKAGGGFRGDELRARARCSHARVEQRKADEQRRVAAARLRELLNLPSDIELYAAEGQVAQLEFIPTATAPETLVQQAMVGRPEIREAKMRRAAAHADRRGTTVGPWIPDVRAGVEVGGFGNVFSNLSDSENWGVGLQWTIGRDGIGGKARQDAAKSRERQWVTRQQMVGQMVVREVAEAHAEALTRGQAIEAAKEGVTDAKEALGLYAKRVKVGVGIPLDAIVAAETLNDAQLDYLDAVIGYNKAQMKLLRAVGHRPDTLQKPPPAVVPAAPAPAPAGPGAPPAGAAGEPQK